MPESRSARLIGPRAHGDLRSDRPAVLGTCLRLATAAAVALLGVFPGLVLDLASPPALRAALGFMLSTVGLAITIDALRRRHEASRYRIATAIFGAVGAALWSLWAVAEILIWLTRL